MYGHNDEVVSSISHFIVDDLMMYDPWSHPIRLVSITKNSHLPGCYGVSPGFFVLKVRSHIKKRTYVLILITLEVQTFMIFDFLSS